jgi:hypothetical protein
MIFKFVGSFSVVLYIASCGSSDSKESVAYVKTVKDYACVTKSTAHTGCCSSHGGFTGHTDCTDAGAVKYDDNGALFCQDGTLSPSCKK